MRTEATLRGSHAILHPAETGVIILHVDCHGPDLKTATESMSATFAELCSLVQSFSTDPFRSINPKDSVPDLFVDKAFEVTDGLALTLANYSTSDSTALSDTVHGTTSREDTGDDTEDKSIKNKQNPDKRFAVQAALKLKVEPARRVMSIISTIAAVSGVTIPNIDWIVSVKTMESLEHEAQGRAIEDLRRKGHEYGEAMGKVFELDEMYEPVVNRRGLGLNLGHGEVSKQSSGMGAIYPEDLEIMYTVEAFEEYIHPSTSWKAM